MNSVFKPFRLKVFLMFIGSVFILYLVNSDMISFVGKNELANIYIDKVSMVNNAWNEKNFNEIDPNELKKEILSTLEIANEENVQIIFMPFDEKSSIVAEHSFLPGRNSAVLIKKLPLTIHFPLLANAVVSFKNQRWLTTRMIANNGIILTMINTKVIDQRMDEFPYFRY